MIVKFLSSKKAKGSKAVDYVLSEERHQESKPKILKGEPEKTQLIIDNIPFEQKATFGVLSFEEENINEDLKYKIMSDFEKTLLPNMDRSNYNILWVEHRDKGRLELNFIIPKIELNSKKSLNPFWDKFDRTRVNQWRDIQNLKYDFTSPLDLKKVHTLSRSKTPLLNEIATKINDDILKNIDNFTSQSDIVNYINTLDDVRAVVPKAKSGDYINVYIGDNKRAIKFKGGIYDSLFVNNNLQELNKIKAEKIRKQEQLNKAKEIQKLEKKLEISIDKKSEAIEEIYKIKPKQLKQKSLAEILLEQINKPQKDNYAEHFEKAENAYRQSTKYHTRNESRLRESKFAYRESREAHAKLSEHYQRANDNYRKAEQYHNKVSARIRRVQESRIDNYTNNRNIEDITKKYRNRSK